MQLSPTVAHIRVQLARLRMESVPSELLMQQRTQPPRNGWSSAGPLDALLEWWGERAAILEFEAGYSREAAESLAEAAIERRYQLPPGWRIH